jgi:putative membrane protein
MNQQVIGSVTMDSNMMLAVERTRVAYERTMMAWIRTGTSLITFGFSVYKFFEFEMKKDLTAVPMLVGPRGFGLILIGIGLFSLMLGTLDHASDMRALRQMHPDMAIRSRSALVALAVGGLGLLAMVAAILNK